jgi:hypothetical protein
VEPAFRSDRGTREWALTVLAGFKYLQWLSEHFTHKST